MPKFIVKERLIDKLDEAIANGCIEALLDRDPTISPTKAPIVLPTSTPSISPSISSQPSSMPSFSPISISYQYSVSYPNDRKPDDIHFARQIRKSGTSVILLANKCEGKTGSETLAEAWQLGLGAPVPLSAAHGDGLIDLFDALQFILPMMAF